MGGRVCEPVPGERRDDRPGTLGRMHTARTPLVPSGLDRRLRRMSAVQGRYLWGLFFGTLVPYIPPSGLEALDMFRRVALSLSLALALVQAVGVFGATAPVEAQSARGVQVVELRGAQANRAGRAMAVN